MAGRPSGGDRPVRVDSRWWYWILAYPLAAVLSVPVMLFLLAVATAPFLLSGVQGPSPGPATGWVAIAILVIVTGLVVLLALPLVVVFVLLPVALFFDARAVTAAAGEWQPDPYVYGLVALLQFVLSPIVGFVIAVYYLYRRHQAVGIP